MPVLGIEPDEREVPGGIGGCDLIAAMVMAETCKRPGAAEGGQLASKGGESRKKKICRNETSRSSQGSLWMSLRPRMSQDTV